MELKEARYILAIARHKSISKAAEALFISQPSLSKYLKNLEQQLGTRLFDRIGNGYFPTYVGERYLHYAEKIVEYGLEWDTELDDIMHQNHGRLNIAIPIMLGNSIIGPTLPRFHKQFPHVTVNMMEEVNFVAEHTLNDHTVDLTFYNVHEYPRDLDYQILGKEEMTELFEQWYEKKWSWYSPLPAPRPQRLWREKASNTHGWIYGCLRKKTSSSSIPTRIPEASP